ncbi:hypothetical protein A7D27_12410 [Pseudomonas sp. 1D4]|uniref:hypothetical protein n=1 Tax=Pseudomonadaceae TaxID=135621 RepID=UPI00084BAA1F|nr:MULTISPECIES: hypothetical protein [Pseudomonas]OEC42095.1 hypothetical protein A7D27_12410 [Pseudomonas sp. 1D4]
MYEPPITPSPSNSTPPRPLRVITRTFGGKPLAILIGHEDFDLAFIVNQVAEVCHIANPSAATVMTMEATSGVGFLQLREVLHAVENPEQIGSWGLERTTGDTWLASSVATYRMLLRFEAPHAQFFREWLNDEVLQELYDSPEAVEATDAYPDEISQLRATIRRLERRLNASEARERRLESAANALDKRLISTTRELLALRRGFPGFGAPADTTPSLLERMQAECDALSYGWRRRLHKDAVGMAGAEVEERLFRRYSGIPHPQG